jgi:DNA polymerase I-like protein with 3'-5' exonuclease and polymerase domains
MGERKVHIRSMIVAPPGKVLVACDLSQAESWIVAFLANERNMKHALMYGDIHTESAGNALFHAKASCAHQWIKQGKDKRWVCEACLNEVTEVMRYVGKRYNHASAYRMGAERAAQVINKDSDKPPYFTVTVKQSKEFSAAWHTYFDLKSWWAEIEATLAATRTLVTPYRRKRTFFAQWGNELFKEATAYVPQSTVADHFKGAVQPELGVVGGLKEVHRQLVKPYPDHKLINESHDSCMLEIPLAIAPEIVARMKELIRRPLIVNNEEFTIPVDAEMGERWGELEKAA